VAGTAGSLSVAACWATARTVGNRSSTARTMVVESACLISVNWLSAGPSSAVWAGILACLFGTDEALASQAAR